MTEFWGTMIGCLTFTLLLIAPYIVNKIIKYKLEIARINAETTIRAEEIRAKNQFEMEKYLKQTEYVADTAAGNGAAEENIYAEPNRSRVRT